jgi:hypothetical protein
VASDDFTRGSEFLSRYNQVELVTSKNFGDKMAIQVCAAKLNNRAAKPKQILNFVLGLYHSQIAIPNKFF